MKKKYGYFIAVLLVVIALWGMAGEYVTRSFGPGGVAVTNSQANACWELASVLVNYTVCATQAVEIARVSGGVTYVLGTIPRGATNVVWWAEQAVPFKQGDVVTIGAGGGSGTVQVIQQVGGR